MNMNRAFSGVAAVLLLVGALTPLTALADEAPSLALEPHCAEQDRSACPFFAVADAEHMATNSMAGGDLLDIDVVLTHDAAQKIRTIRSWLKYDPQALEVRSVELAAALAEPIPDEQSFDATLGLVKIGGGTTGDLPGGRVALARVTFRVIDSSKNTEISFSGFQPDGLGQTAINTSSEMVHHDGGLSEPPCIGGLICQKKMVALLVIQPSALSILLAPPVDAAAPPMDAPPADPPAEMNQPPPAQANPTPDPSAASSFSLLQIQGLRITSHESSIFLGWQELRSSELAGYNVYYGTVSGKYMQRRSIPSASTSLVLRDLEPGTTYFASVRGFNANNQESVFSQEVSVTVGNPESSSSPLIAEAQTETPAIEGNPIEKHGGTEINGSTGSGDSIFVFAALSALIGTGFALSRQCALSSSLLRRAY